MVWICSFYLCCTFWFVYRRKDECNILVDLACDHGGKRLPAVFQHEDELVLTSQVFVWAHGARSLHPAETGGEWIET